VPLSKRDDSPYWQLRIGRSYRKSTGTEDYSEAQRIEAIVTERLRRLRFGDRGATSWAEAAQRWLDLDAKAKRRDRELLDWLNPIIGIEPISAVDADALEALRKKGREVGWSQSTIDRLMGTVSAVLNAAANWRLIDSAPAVPMYRPAKGEPRWLSPPEFERLCRELAMHQVLAARFAVHSLLRMRAQAKLRWDRIDFAQRRAWIPASEQKAGRTFGFPLTDELIRILRAMRWLSPPASPYVFTWLGKPIDDFNTRSFQEAVKRAGVAPLRWHDLRHTGASWAVQSGVTLPELMVLGDWTDYRSVLRYAHLAPAHAAVAAEKVARWAHAGRAAKPEARARKQK
jgi:integrase